MRVGGGAGFLLFAWMLPEGALDAHRARGREPTNCTPRPPWSVSPSCPPPTGATATRATPAAPHSPSLGDATIAAGVATASAGSTRARRCTSGKRVGVRQVCACAAPAALRITCIERELLCAARGVKRTGPGQAGAPSEHTPDVGHWPPADVCPRFACFKLAMTVCMGPGSGASGLRRVMFEIVRPFPARGLCMCACLRIVCC